MQACINRLMNISISLVFPLATSLDPNTVNLENIDSFHVQHHLSKIGKRPAKLRNLKQTVNYLKSLGLIG